MQSAALQWYMDQGVDAIVGDEPVDRFRAVEDVIATVEVAPMQAMHSPPQATVAPDSPALVGAVEAQKQALAAANGASSLDELRAAIEAFDGIELKATASHMVFADGNPEAKIMVIGEAPGADEDRQGKPFVGAGGQLLDKIFGSIGLDRAQDYYVTNVLNWRPPGNRTPTTAEIAVSLPFIERHIALVQPQILILCGGVAAKALLGKNEGISRLRRGVHSYDAVTEGLEGGVKGVDAMAVYHPDYLLQTPLQKRAMWADMLALQERLAQKAGQGGE